MSPKTFASTAYATQLDFQFGSADCCRRQLSEHGKREAQRLGGGTVVEVVRTSSAPDHVISAAADTPLLDRPTH